MASNVDHLNYKRHSYAWFEHLQWLQITVFAAIFNCKTKVDRWCIITGVKGICDSKQKKPHNQKPNVLW